MMNWVKQQTWVDTISKSSKDTSDLHKLLINLLGKTNLNRSDKYVA